MLTANSYSGLLLPAYLAGWDLAMLPFARNESTRFISPTKTPEYLATGKPVVSTSMRDVVRPYEQERLVGIAAREGFRPSVYSRSKALAEARVLKAYPSSLVIRTSAFFGPWDEYNFVTIALRQLAAGQTFVAAQDSVVSPTYVLDLVNASLDLLIDGECGLWHLANNSAIAWAELARMAASLAGVDASLIEARPTRELGLVAPRPTYSVLGSERGVLLPSFDNAMSRYFDERQS